MKDSISPNTESTPSDLVHARVRQRRGFQDWVRFILIGLILLWLVTFVLLPLGQLFLKATHTEFTVEISGKNEIQIGDTRIKTNGDGIPGLEGLVVPESGQVLVDGGEMTWQEGLFRYNATRVKVRDEWLTIAPLIIERRGENWSIDGRALESDETARTVERYIGFSNFIDYFGRANLRRSAINSLFVAVLTTVITIILAFGFAYGLTRTLMPLKGFFRVIAMLPLFAPTMLYGLSLVYMFGHKGIVTTGFFDHPAFTWLQCDIGLYGWKGIVIAETVFAFPPTMMILMVALSGVDARLYEAAASLGAGRIRTFFTVTLPAVIFGLVSAIFVCFTLSFTDFGAPKIVGGNFNVLAVDIYKQVVGQQNMGMGATVSIILLVPAVICFAADYLVRRRQTAGITARSVPFHPKRHPLTDWTMFGFCSLIAFYILAMLFTAGYASLVKIWPYNLGLTLKHYLFEDVVGGGYNVYWNSVKTAVLSAVIGTGITFLIAYLIEKSKGFEWLRRAAYFLSIIPLALPGLVIGIAYIFFFNKPAFNVFGVHVGNPFTHIYGTIWILVIANIVHFFTVSFLTATTSLRQLDKEFESVSDSMAVPFYVTFFRVTAPVSLPALLEIAMYYFVSSMSTVSAVVFLYSADACLASVSVINMNDAGDELPASAMCMLIVVTNIAARILFELATVVLRKQTQAWRKR